MKIIKQKAAVSRTWSDFYKRLLCYCNMNDSGNFLCSKGSTINNSKAVCPFVFMLFVFVCKMCFKCSFSASLSTFTRALITSSYYFMKHQKYFQLGELGNYAISFFHLLKNNLRYGVESFGSGS